MTHPDEMKPELAQANAPLESFLADVFGDEHDSGIIDSLDVETYDVSEFSKVVLLWRYGHEPEYDKIQAKLSDTVISWSIDQNIDPALPVHRGQIPGAEVSILDDHNLENPVIIFEFHSPPAQISSVIGSVAEL